MDLTHARSITVALTRHATGHWHYAAHVDGRTVCEGVAASPDEAVDAAEAHMWPQVEAKEHGGTGSPHRLPERPDEQRPGAIPTHQQLWASEAKHRAQNKDTLAKL